MLDKKTKGVFESVQILRAIAAAMVVLFHAQITAREWAGARGLRFPTLDSFGSFQSFGGIGVDLFFVISGFIMASVAWEKFGTSENIKPFILKRFVRIAPIYWFYTFCFVILSYVLKDFSQGRTIDFKKTLFSVFFLPTLDADGTKSHVLAVAWTLVYEIFFYACVCIALPFGRKYFLPIVAFIFLLVVLILPGIIGHILNRDFPFMKNAGLLIEFLYGIIICVLLKREFRVGMLLPSFLLFAGVVFMGIWIAHPFPYARAVSWGLPCAFILFGCVFLECQRTLPLRLGWLIGLGDASYSLYLVHLIIFNLVMIMLKNLAAPLPADFVMLLLTISSIAASYTLYARIEKRLTHIATSTLLPSVKQN